MPRRPRRYFLLKSEPSVYSIDDLARDGTAMWEGVRNYQARNLMRDEMAVGDLALFYHSNAAPPGVAGVARIVRSAYPDPEQFDRKSPYFDAGASRDQPRWVAVDVELVERFDRLVSLEELRQTPSLAEMMVLRRGMRLSVQPVDRKHFRTVLRLAGARTRVR
ncbi:MAG: EVE domain-containing protein [Deltaproteobacteria bacterium]|jgi:predicted RNA-binding protein with PUA-like domain|nr:EVE domain-containing protein [Deltaproteobacteria bacterium]MBW2532963.1 EVE domain-containing protein [Deltaproteobacteria bacterium]